MLKKKIIAEKEKNKLVLITSHILSDLEDLSTHVVYLQEGKLIFYKDLPTLQLETREQKLSRAIAYFMKKNNPVIPLN